LRGRRQRRFPWFVAMVAVAYAALVCIGMVPLPFLPTFTAANGGGLVVVHSDDGTHRAVNVQFNQRSNNARCL
jgi:hypothetical protein